MSKEAPYNHKNPWKNCPEYYAWESMNRNYGSEVCVLWGWMYRDKETAKKNYESFLSYVGKRKEGQVLIRLDKSQPFGPGNVRWGSHAENAQKRGPFRKFSYSRDEELIAEIRKRGYTVNRA